MIRGALPRERAIPRTQPPRDRGAARAARRAVPALPPTPSLENVTLDRSVRVLGVPDHLDALFRRLTAGEPIVLGLLGASVAQNAGCLDQGQKRCMGYSGINNKPKGWAVRFLEHINATFPHAHHRINNSALDATSVESFAACLFSHLPGDVHLVVTEWGSMGNFNHHMLPSIEKVMRSLLALPSQPVVVHFGFQELCTQKLSPRALYRTGDQLLGRTTAGFIYPDTPWARVELEATRVCMHYGQPCLSTKEAVEPHALRGEGGFELGDLTGDDCLHPANGRHGIAYAAQMLGHWFDHALRLWQETASKQRRRRPAPRKTSPPPLHAQNGGGKPPSRCYAFKRADTLSWSKLQALHPLDWCTPQGALLHGARRAAPANATSCVPGLGRSRLRPDCGLEDLPRAVAKLSAAEQREWGSAAYRALMAAPPTGWFWCGVSLSPKLKPSGGVVALRPGAVLLATLDAFLPSAAAEAGAAAADAGLAAAADGGAARAEARAEEEVTLLLHHLISYEGMGRVRVQCEGGCACAPLVVDAHRIDETRNASVFVETPLAATARAAGSGGAGGGGGGGGSGGAHANGAADGVPVGACLLRLTVLRGSSSGAHKFKLRGVRVAAGRDAATWDPSTT